MKFLSRRVSAAALALFLSLLLSSAAFAAPRRDREPEWPRKVIRVIQKFFGVSAQDNQPIPPKP